MEILQIVVLFVGAILFTVSFFIPDRQVNTKEIREKEEKIVKDIIDKELADVRRRVDEITEESIERAKDTTERQMDRITNEKMMAINEYSDTVMTEIHKNHEEAVFLYDMLNNKHAQVKTTAAELNQTIKLSKQTQSATKSKPSEKKREKADAVMVDNDSFEPITTSVLQDNAETIRKEKVDTEIQKKEEIKAGEINYDKVSVGTILNRPYDEYYVLDDKEAEENTISLRSRKDGDLGAMPVDEVLAKIYEENDTKAHD